MQIYDRIVWIHNVGLEVIRVCSVLLIIQGGSNMTGTNCDLFTHNQSRSYLNHLVIALNVTVTDLKVSQISFRVQIFLSTTSRSLQV